MEGMQRAKVRGRCGCEWRGRRWGGDPVVWAAGEARPAMVVACGWCACPGSWSRVGHNRRKGRACLWCRDTWGSRPGSSAGGAGAGCGGAGGAGGPGAQPTFFRSIKAAQAMRGGGLVAQRWRSENRAGGSRLRAGLDSSACAPGCLRPAKGAGLRVGVLRRWRLQRPGTSATCVRCVPSVAGQAGAVHGGLGLLLPAVGLGRAVVPRYSGGRRTPSSGSAMAYLFVHPEQVGLVVSVRVHPGDAFGPPSCSVCSSWFS